MLSRFNSPTVRWIVTLFVFALAGVFWNRWWPAVNRMVHRVTGRSETAEHDHDHAAHAPSATATFLDLSPEALKNLGLTPDMLRPIELGVYQRSINVPAMIVERPGQTLMQIATPMTGVVTDVAAVEGAAVEPGQKLFRIRLTHEDLVQTQTEFVRTLGELDVEAREIARLEGVTEKGAIAGKALLERQYAREKLEALLQSQREALRLHGLSARQIDQMAKDRRLLSELTITSPASHESSSELQLTANPALQPISFVATQQEAPAGNAPPAAEIPLVMEKLSVQRGQAIDQGGQLCVLANYSSLYIEGQAFEQDVEAINQAVSQSWKITSLFPGGQSQGGLNLAFVASEIDPESRTLKFYVDLPNEVLRDTRNSAGQRFLTWRYKPGQRLQLQVPVEVIENQIVLPLDAVALEGAESYVYQRVGKGRFNQVAVHVLHRDQTTVVIANDGTLFPGDTLAWRSAHRMRMEIKNKSGGAIDPHAGHSH